MNFYPLGTIVILEGGNKQIMICGRLQENNESKEIFDYAACLYPEGVIRSDQMYLFQHEDIKTVLSVGYETHEEKAYQEVLKKAKEKNL